MKTKITELLGIEYPIIQGGMAWISEGHLAAAVSNAGGLGLIAAGNAPTAWVKEQIEIAKSKTDKPFGVNIMLMSENSAEVAELVCQEGVKVVTTGAGNPGKYIARWKEFGIKVIPVIPSVALAIRMERAGADAVIAEGTEAGGHIGELTSMVLIPQVVDALNIPVIGAGGIADGRGIAAAFMLGAEGVQVGTRFLCADECRVHGEYKRMVLEAKDTDTLATGRSTGHPVRVLKNPLARKIVELEKANEDVQVIEQLCNGTLRLAAVDGDIKNGSVMAGQSAGLVKSIQPAQDIIKEMFTQAEKLLK